MNKLNVALKLLQLLNDRKNIDTKDVANELNVCLRTAQRYLLELSMMPCVIFNEKSRTYSLNSNYKLNDVLVNGSNYNYDDIKNNNIKINSSNDMICLICGRNRNFSDKIPLLCRDDNIFTNKNVIDELVTIINKSIGCHKCSFSKDPGP